MDNMTAAEMCEVLNPMLALNKLTVYSNARRGVGHVVTDNVIAADTTKYRNPLDKILPEYDYETLLAQTTSDGATEPQELEKYSEQKVADTSERACVINQKPDTSGNFANENSNIPPTSKQQHILEGKEASGCNAKKSDVPRNATDTDPPKNEPEALEEPYKDTGRYSRGPKQAAESSLKGGPPIVTLVRESSAFGGVLCCGKNTKMVPVTRITSPSSVEEARLSRRKRTTGANVRPNVSAGQQRQADCQDHLYLLDVSTDLTSSTSHETLTSETNASSVALLPVLPAIPLSGNKTRECKPSPPLLRRGDSRSPCVRDISRTYSPTQAIQNSARNVASYFSSSASSSPSLDDINRSSSKNFTCRNQPSRKVQSPTLSMMSGAKTEPQRPKSTKNNFRRAKSIVAISSNSPKSVRKIYQGVGKRSLSPNKSPQETRKIPAISCLTLAAESSHNLGNCPSPATKLLRKKAVQESLSYNPRGNRK